MPLQEHTVAAPARLDRKLIVVSKSCTLCSKTFTEKRKAHACYKCFKQFCKRHSRSRLAIGEDPRPVRVCDSCFDDLYFAMDEKQQSALQAEQAKSRDAAKAIKRELRESKRQDKDQPTSKPTSSSNQQQVDQPAPPPPLVLRKESMPPPPPPPSESMKLAAAVAVTNAAIWCSKCKDPLAPKDRFCHGCGTPVAPTSSSSSSSSSSTVLLPPPPPLEEAPVEQKVKKPKKPVSRDKRLRKILEDDEPVGIDSLEVTVTLALVDNKHMEHKKAQAQRRKIQLMKKANQLHYGSVADASAASQRLLDTTDDFVFTEEVREVRKRCRVDTQLQMSDVLVYLIERFYGMRQYYDSCRIQNDGAFAEQGSIWFEARLSKDATSATFPLRKKNWKSVCRACVKRNLTCILVRIMWRPVEGTVGVIQQPVVDMVAEMEKRREAKEAAEAAAASADPTTAVLASSSAKIVPDKKKKSAIGSYAEEQRRKKVAADRAAESKSSIMMEGLVHKRSPGLIRFWQKRYMRLDSSCMMIKYYKSEKDKYGSAIGSIPVPYITAVEPAISGQLTGKFKVVTDTRTFELRAPDNDTALEWIEQINSCMQVCRLERQANFNPASALANNVSNALKHNKNLSISNLLNAEAEDGEVRAEQTGLLRKRQPDGLRLWQERFFVLNEAKRRLEWFPKAHMRFKDPKETNIVEFRAVIHVCAPALETEEQRDQENIKADELVGRFDVWVEGHRRYELLASSAQVRDEWMRAIRDEALERRPHPMKNPEGQAADRKVAVQKKNLENMLLEYVKGRSELAKGRISAKGNLWKRSNDFGIERWTERFFVVLPSSGRLVYYASESDYAGGTGHALGLILRENIEKITLDDHSKQGEVEARREMLINKNLSGHFQIHTRGGRVFFLDAKSEIKGAKWVHAIRKLMEHGTAAGPEVKSEIHHTQHDSMSVVLGSPTQVSELAQIVDGSSDEEEEEEEEEEDFEEEEEFDEEGALAEELDEMYNSANRLQAAEPDAPHRVDVELKECLVIDNGCYSIKLGLASEARPSMVERTVFARPLDKKNDAATEGVASGSDLHPLQQAYDSLMLRERAKELSAVTNNVLDRDTRNYVDLQLMWKLCVQRLGDLDLTHRPVLLTYPLGTNVAAFTRAAQHTFLEDLGFTFLSLQLAPELAAYSYGRFTALIVDVGYGGVQVLPVVNGEALQRAAVSNTFASGMRVDEIVKSGLVHDYGWLRDELDAHVLQEMVEDIRMRLSFVCYNKKQYSQLISTKSVARRYQLPTGKHVVLSAELAQFGEIYFQPELFKPQVKRKIVTQSLPQMILQAVMQCPEEVRDELLGNVAVCGAVSKMPGFEQRLRAELHLEMRGEEEGQSPQQYADLRDPQVLLEHGQEFTVWSGGAILTHLKTFRESLMSKWDIQ